MPDAVSDLRGVPLGRLGVVDELELLVDGVGEDAMVPIAVRLEPDLAQVALGSKGELERACQEIDTMRGTGMLT